MLTGGSAGAQREDKDSPAQLIPPLRRVTALLVAITRPVQQVWSFLGLAKTRICHEIKRDLRICQSNTEMHILSVIIG